MAKKFREEDAKDEFKKGEERNKAAIEFNKSSIQTRSESYKEMIDFQIAEQKRLQRIEEQTLRRYKDFSFDVFQAVGSAFGNSMTGQDANARDVLKNIAGMFITMAESAMFAATAMANAKGIATFWTSMIADAPALIAGFTALETGRAVINKTHTGGIVGQEVPIIAQRGEMFLNSDQQSNLFKMIAENKGGRGNQTIILQIGRKQLRAEINAAISENVRLRLN
jgi:hypothetical protein